MCITATGTPARPAPAERDGVIAVPSARRHSPTRVMARYGVAALAGVTLLVLCELLLTALAGRAMGWSIDVVMSGSMSPRLLPGDLVLTQPVQSAAVRPGQVVLVRDPAHPDRLLMHRLIGRRPDGSLVTKGDANADSDSTPVPPDWVRGLPRLRLPYLGLPQLWLALRQYHWLAGVAFGLMLAVGLALPRGLVTARAHRPPGPRHARSRHARSRRGRRRRPSGGRRIAPAGVALTLGVALLVTVGSPSRAAFRSTANTGTNSITAGTVSFGANSPATAVLSASNVIPGTTGSGCVKLTYQGSLTATVKAYVAAGGLTGTGLGSYLTFQLNEGTGNNSDCSDFALASTDYNATGMSNTGSTIATFAGSSTGYATGVGAWSAATNATRTYQFVWQVADNNSAAGTNMSVTFTWEAQA